MCKPETIRKIDNGEAIVISRIRLIAYLALILIAFVATITTTKLQAMDNSKRLDKVEKPIDEMYFNMKHLFEENGWIWVEKKE